MGEPKFTPGPWCIEKSSEDFYYISQSEPFGTIAGSWSGGTGNHKANAHLIAAAPELYVALNRLLDRYHPYRDNQDDSDWAAAVAAIAKARGET